jgi:uncharacterized SAM-binding protein YcdF (DUF218 family)
MSFLYSIFLKLLYPTSLCLVGLLASAIFRRRKVVSRVCFWGAVAVLVFCGNGWVVGAMTKYLERQYPSLKDHGTTNESRNWESRNLKSDETTGRWDGKTADCILVLSGGILSALPPRPTIEIEDAGDRLLYGAHLFRQGEVPHIICTGNVATGGISVRPVAEDMAEFFKLLGIPKDSILTEIKSENTHQHAVHLAPMLEQRGFKRVLLVTSAMHMPRSVGVFKRECPGIEFIAAPTDFRVVERSPMPWYRHLTAFLPTPRSLLDFSEVMHEYLGIAYYRLRGWM